jgi:glycine C-acetyltransferase/8-amino-7-oxononanoate synthase
LRDYLGILPEDALLLVDDAHGVGLLGGRGRGSCEHNRVSRRRIIQTLTLSKAFGTYGGAVIGTAGLRRKILRRSQIFFGSTPLPLPLVNAALKSVKILRKDQNLRRRLSNNVQYVRKALASYGFKFRDTSAPIFALYPSRTAEIKRLKFALLRARIFPSFIRYPGAPATGYFRFVLSSEHTSAQLENLVDVLRRDFMTCTARTELVPASPLETGEQDFLHS